MLTSDRKFGPGRTGGGNGVVTAPLAGSLGCGTKDDGHSEADSGRSLATASESPNTATRRFACLDKDAKTVPRNGVGDGPVPCHISGRRHIHV